jgi:aspartoacylase
MLAELGPKSAKQGSNVDLVIDLHSSTSDVGLVCMLAASDSDPLSLSLATALAASPQHEKDGVVRVTTTEGSKAEAWSVDSICLSGLSLEVGPLCHGVLSHALLDKTRRLVISTLDLIEARNLRLLALLPPSLTDEERRAVAFVNPENSAWSPPPPEQRGFPLVDVFVPSRTIDFPAPQGLGQGQGWVVHPSLDCANFKEVFPGDPLFLSTDGRDEVIAYEPPPSSGLGPTPSSTDPAPLFSVFVNEAAYRDRGVALALYEKKLKPSIIPF